MSFESAIITVLINEIGPQFDPLHPACIHGHILSDGDRRATGYVNDPTDLGGETKFGIAKSSHPDLNIRNLKLSTAKSIYFNEYWKRSNCDNIVKLDDGLATLFFDSCVNHGIPRAVKFLQQSCGAIVDGVIGPNTMQKLAKSDLKNVYNKFIELRRQFFLDIVKNRPEQNRFLKGWLKRVDSFVR